MTEIWLPIEGYDNYEISNRGRVRSWKMGAGSNRRADKPRILHLGRCGRGKCYPAVSMCHEGKQKTHKVHTLVLNAFVGPPPTGHKCRHLDNNPLNNNIDNLKWGTKSENEKDKPRYPETEPKV